MKPTGLLEFSSAGQREARRGLTLALKDTPIPVDQILSNLGLFLLSKDLSRILFMDVLYKQILTVPGIVVDFGTRWGNNMGIFSALRGIYEPYNRHRLVVGFDTFSGFPGVTKEDGGSELMKPGNVSTVPDYEKYLDMVLSFHNTFDPSPAIIKYEIRKGDAVKQFTEYLHENPQTIVSLAYFDFDLYEPTKQCLKLLLPHLTQGSVVAFDELNDKDSPGETTALQEILGVDAVKLQRLSTTTRTSYFVYEGQHAKR